MAGEQSRLTREEREGREEGERRRQEEALVLQEQSNNRSNTAKLQMERELHTLKLQVGPWAEGPHGPMGLMGPMGRGADGFYWWPVSTVGGRWPVACGLL